MAQHLKFEKKKKSKKKGPQCPGGFFHNLNFFKEPRVEVITKVKEMPNTGFRGKQRVLLNRR